MDGLRGVWHAGPFSTDKRYRFYPKQMKFGTDPVAMDRLLIDVIDGKRKQEGAISVWERDMKYYSSTPRGLAGEPEREPLHSRAGTHPVRLDARPGRLRYEADQSHGTHCMTGMTGISRGMARKIADSKLAG